MGSGSKSAAAASKEPVVDVDMRQQSSLPPRDPRRALAAAAVVKKEPSSVSDIPSGVKKENQEGEQKKDLFGSINIQALVSKLKSEVRNEKIPRVWSLHPLDCGYEKDL